MAGDSAKQGGGLFNAAVVLMKRVTLIMLFAGCALESAYAMRLAPEELSDRWTMAQARLARALRAPERWWRQLREGAPLRYDAARIAASDPGAFPADRPRQIDVFPRSEARAQLDRELLPLAGFPEGGGLSAGELEALFRRVDGVNPHAYIRDILDQLKIASLPDDAAKVAQIVAFAQRAVGHDPIVAPPTYDPIAILEFGKGRCGHVNYNVLPALLNEASFRTRRVRLPGHAALEVWYGDAWHFVDADMLKNGDLLRTTEGTIPSVEWLTVGSNALLVDTHATWPDAYAYGGAPVNAAGKRVTGFIGTGNPEDLGYPSSRFGAPLAYPPSPPELQAREITVSDPQIRLRWGGSYDRDGDLAGYVLEIGSAALRSDVQVLETQHNVAEVRLPAPGVYFYRVRAYDHRRKREPRMFYRPSEEGIIRYGPALDSNATLAAPVAVDGWPLLSPLAGAGMIGSPNFEVVRVDATGESRLFFVDWFDGRALKVVDLSDNRFPGGSIQGPKDQVAQWSRPLQLPQEPSPIAIGFDLYLERRGYGGTAAFAIIALDAGAQTLAIFIDPERDALFVAPMPSRRSEFVLEPKYWIAYPGEWTDPKAGPEVVVVRASTTDQPAPLAQPVPIQVRNAWRIAFEVEPVSDASGSARWRMRFTINGSAWGQIMLNALPSRMRLLTNPSDEVVYVIDDRWIDR